MQNTYHSDECSSSENLNFEEKLIPEEIGEKKACPNGRKHPIKTKPVNSDDLFLILILLLLMKECEDDGIFLFILMAVIFGK